MCVAKNVGESQSTRKEPPDMWNTDMEPKPEKDPRLYLSPGPSCCEETVLSTALIKSDSDTLGTFKTDSLIWRG